MKPKFGFSTRPWIYCLSVFLVLLGACAARPQDVQGLYAGAIQDLNGKTSEYFIQLYANGQYAMRKTVYDEAPRSVSRTGAWSVSGSTVILVADGEKDLRFAFERSALRLEAAATAEVGLPFDQVSLRRIGP